MESVKRLNNNPTANSNTMRQKKLSMSNRPGCAEAKAKRIPQFSPKKNKALMGSPNATPNHKAWLLIVILLSITFLYPPPGTYGTNHYPTQNQRDGPREVLRGHFI